jgi:hypothetical protein
MIKNYGFVAPVIESHHYVLGGAVSLPGLILQPSRQWDAFLPKYEPQFGDGWDTHGCTVWGTQNAIEILEKRLFGHDKDYSERYNYIIIGIRPPGSDPHLVAESIRKVGLVDNGLLPLTKTYEDFVQPSPMTRSILLTGMNYLKYRNFGHEWVFTGDMDKQKKINLMMDALQYSPLGVSVSAWFQDTDGIFRDHGQPNGHWCVCYGHTDKGWKIFDSYDQSTKVYSYDSEISFCKRYHLTGIDAITRPTLWQKITAIFKKVFNK